MKKITDEQRTELLKLVLETNYKYYLQSGMSKAHMHPDEILREFQTACDDYSVERIEILQARLSELEPKNSAPH